MPPVPPPPEPQQPKIRIQNLIKIFGDRPAQALQQFDGGADRQTILANTGQVLAVADVSLEIYPGELFVVMGLSGSGKSTLIRCLNQLIPPTRGQIYLDDEDISSASPARLREFRRTKVTMVFQRFALFPHRTVVENVAYGLKVQGVGKAQRRQKALQVLETVGLDSYWADALPSALSGGMQQRVGLARALATDADVLLMDEAFSALDPLIRRDMQDELIRLQADFHKTIVFISHDIHEALKIGDRVAVMKEGAVVQVADPETLIKAPADEYITAFMQDVNRAQVLTAGSIARQIPPIVLSQASVASALDHLHQYQRLHLHGVDDSGCPVGLLQRQDLEQAQGQTELAAVMQRQFPKVSQSIALEALFPLCQQGLPLAVIDAQGQWQGIIELTDVFASLT